jgi:aspartyl aminopeptidase
LARNSDADALIDFLNASPTPFHAVATAEAQLKALGAIALDEKSTWNPSGWQPGQIVYIIRNQSSLVALRLPMELDSQDLSFRIVAAHTDSPCLKLKPRPPEPTANYRQWGVEVYGGILYNSWLDRDLGVAGRITSMGPDGIYSTLVRSEEKPWRIPQLAIHLDRNVNEAGLILNAQRHLMPIIGLNDPASQAFESWLVASTGTLLQDMTFELHLYDTTPASYGGSADEFIFSGRLDNLAMSHAALEAFCREPASASLIQVAALFDNEEVGSTSAQGANSNLIEAVMERCLMTLEKSREEVMTAQARSYLISADMAHAIHPNYPERHEPNHYPLINHGPVVKGNVNMRYATNGETSAQFKTWCRRAGVPVQDFVNRTDLACGTTIGPHVAAALGIPTVDVGNPMLSMHSAREMCGSEDHGMMIRVMQEFYRV